MTLKMGIEKALKEEVPEVNEVVAIDSWRRHPERSGTGCRGNNVVLGMILVFLLSTTGFEKHLTSIYDAMKNIFKMDMVGGPLRLKSSTLGGRIQMAQDYGREIGKKLVE